MSRTCNAAGVAVAMLLLLSGCGTTQHAVPIQPLEKGTVEWRVSLGFSTSKFSVPSLQFGVYGGLSSRDVVGVSFNNCILPSHLGYARYITFSGTDRTRGSVQLHLGNILAGEYNPIAEVDFALSTTNAAFSHAAKVGLGYYSSSFLQQAFGVEHTRSLAPIAGYQFQTHSVEGEIEMIYGLSRYFAGYYHEGGGYGNPTPVRIPHDSIRTITRHGADDKTCTWTVELMNGESLLIMNRDPYADCFACAQQQKGYQAYLASDDDRVVWVSGSDVLPHMMEVNMKSILAHYQAGGDLEIYQQEGLVSAIRNKIRSGIDDIGFSIGYYKRKE